MPPLELSEWGEGGPPPDYDPQATTGPLPLGGLSESAEVPPEPAVPETAVPETAVPETAVPETAVPEAEVPETAVPEAEVPETAVPEAEVPEAEVPEAEVPEAEVPEAEVPEAEVPEAEVAEAGERAGEGGPGPDGELTPPGLNITVAPEQIGYPRDVVPGAELVRRVSSDEGTQLPHWADPPTGEVPRALAGTPGADDDLQGWRLLGSKGLRWREDMSDWSDGPGVEDLVDPDTGQGNLMEPPAGNRFSFDEDFERLERKRAQRASAAADATVEIVDVAAAAAEVSGQVTDYGELSRGAAPVRPAEGPGDGPGAAQVGAAPQLAQPPEGEKVAGAGSAALFVEAVGQAKGPVGTAAAGPGGRAVGGNGEGMGAQAAGPHRAFPLRRRGRDGRPHRHQDAWPWATRPRPRRPRTGVPKDGRGGRQVRGGASRPRSL